MENQLTKEQILSKVEKTRSRFDLEQDILTAWNVTDHLDIFLRQFLDGAGVMSVDAVANKLFSIKEVANMRFEELWETFEEAL